MKSKQPEKSQNVSGGGSRIVIVMLIMTIIVMITFWSSGNLGGNNAKLKEIPSKVKSPDDSTLVAKSTPRPATITSDSFDATKVTPLDSAIVARKARDKANELRNKAKADEVVALDLEARAAKARHKANETARLAEESEALAQKTAEKAVGEINAIIHRLERSKEFLAKNTIIQPLTTTPPETTRTPSSYAPPLQGVSPTAIPPTRVNVGNPKSKDFKPQRKRWVRSTR